MTRAKLSFLLRKDEKQRKCIKLYVPICCSMDRKWLTILCILLLVCVSTVLYHQSIQHSFNVLLRPKPQPKYKRILFWTPIFGEYGPITTGHSYGWCQVSNCESTPQKNELESVDAVIFHIRDVDLNNLPKYHPPNQKWIFLLQESPPHTITKLHSIDGIFNWTMSYRLDADIFMPYGTIEKKAPLDEIDKALLTEDTTAPKNYIDGKMRLAVWYASNCKTHGNREGYIKALQKYMRIDIFGKCGPYRCAKDRAEYCLKEAAKTYKFYFSFENSICKDYISEKFYQVLKHDIVPVVFGGGNYSAVAPPHSYINALDFPNPKNLAAYLHFLDKNNTHYQKYFEWKSTYTINGNALSKVGWCALCAKVNSRDYFIPKMYPSISQWWFDGQCISDQKWT